MSRDFSDLTFRLLFSLIFIGLGGEHMLNDELLMRVTPEWLTIPRTLSFLCGIFLVCGGALIALGYRLKWASFMLGTFIIVVTALVHAPGLSTSEVPLASPEDAWIWHTLQRSNFVKNLCLLGVCLRLPHYTMGSGRWKAISSDAQEDSQRLQCC